MSLPKVKEKILKIRIKNTINIIILIFFFLSPFYTCKRLSKKPIPFNYHQKFPNIILIINDALRSDFLGFNGAQDVSTPNLDLFASQCINFRNAISQAGCTDPSVASILTGLYPIRHGFFNRHRPFKLKPTVVTLQEYLRSLGYMTGAFVGATVTTCLVNRGFLERSDFGFEDSKGKRTIDQVIQFLEQNKYFPYFLLIHILDPHSPYSPSKKLIYPDEIMKGLSKADREKLANGIDTSRIPRFSKVNIFNYKREIEELDEYYGRFFYYLFNCPSHIFNKGKDIIIFTADHGEEFPHENGYYHHGRSPYIETMRVPLLLYLYGRDPLTIYRYVENASIYPTIMELLGFEQNYIESLGLSTTSLLRFISIPENKRDISYVLSEAIYMDKNLPISLDVNESKSIIRSDGYKLIYNTTTKKSMLFDLENDPKEENNLLESKDIHLKQIAMELFQQLKNRTNLLYDYRQLSK